MSYPGWATYLRRSWLQILGLSLGIAAIIVTLLSAERDTSRWVILVLGLWLIVWNLLQLLGVIKLQRPSTKEHRSDADDPRV